MRGMHRLRVRSAHIAYDMAFVRNITIIQGDSATGKTTLVDMIREWQLNGADTGITLTCDVPCRVLGGNAWQEALSRIEDSIVFVDEGNRFVSSVDFSRAVRGSSNYFVIVTREALDNLPYSVTEVYGIRSSGRYGRMEPVYHQMYRIYGDGDLRDAGGQIIVTEDSNSGHDFFLASCAGTKVRCVSGGGAGRIFGLLQELGEDEGVTVVADGAAFGSQMGRVHQLITRRGGIRLYLPESFEWLILSSGILDDKEVREILERPHDYIDSSQYLSWERFFTKLLVDKTKGTWMQYSKARLNPVYLQGKCRERILMALPPALREMLDASLV